MFGMTKASSFPRKSKKLPQGDNTLGKPKVPKTGPDDDASMKMNENMTSPNLPQRDGPARDKVDGGMPLKPATSEKPKMDKKMMKSMKASLGGIGKF